MDHMEKCELATEAEIWRASTIFQAFYFQRHVLGEDLFSQNNEGNVYCLDTYLINTGILELKVDIYIFNEIFCLFCFPVHPLSSTHTFISCVAVLHPVLLHSIKFQFW